jgi:hypothetical protein
MQVYPLFAAVGVAVGICGFQLARNICINPEVRYSSSSTLSMHVCVMNGVLFLVYLLAPFFCRLDCMVSMPSAVI